MPHVKRIFDRYLPTCTSTVYGAHLDSCPSAANGPRACPTTATTAACSPPGLATMLALSLRLYRACPLVWTIPNLSITTRCCAFLLLRDANRRGASHRVGAFSVLCPPKAGPGPCVVVVVVVACFVGFWPLFSFAAALAQSFFSSLLWMLRCVGAETARLVCSGQILLSSFF